MILSPTTIQRASGQQEAPTSDVTQDLISRGKCYMEVIHLYNDSLRKLHRKIMELRARLDTLTLHAGQMESVLRTMENCLSYMEHHIGYVGQSLAEIERHIGPIRLNLKEHHTQVDQSRARL